MEYNLEFHVPDVISDNLFKGIKEWDESISSIVLKLFDLLFEKEFNYEITQVLILDFFNESEFETIQVDLFQDAPEWAIFNLKSPITLEPYLQDA